MANRTPTTIYRAGTASGIAAETVLPPCLDPAGDDLPLAVLYTSAIAAPELAPQMLRPTPNAARAPGHVVSSFQDKE